jgi:hypothetical protein
MQASTIAFGQLVEEIWGQDAVTLPQGAAGRVLDALSRAGLKDHHMQILFEYLGLDGRPRKKEKDIASLVGLSRERVRQVVWKGLRTLRRPWIWGMASQPPPLDWVTGAPSYAMALGMRPFLFCARCQTQRRHRCDGRDAAYWQCFACGQGRWWAETKTVDDFNSWDLTDVSQWA